MFLDGYRSLARWRLAPDVLGRVLPGVAGVPPSGRAVSLIVPTGSTASTIGDLKGKKIAFQKTSIGHYLLVKALTEVGLTLEDVESVYLPPPDANAAFSQGAVDAWFIREPFVTRAVQSGSGRVLFDGEHLRDSCNFLDDDPPHLRPAADHDGLDREAAEVAALWLRLGFLPARIDVRPGFLSPSEYARLAPRALDSSR